MSLPAGTIHIGGIACTPDGAVYVEPTGSASITGGSATFDSLALSTGAITTGTYTPTLTNSTNIAASTAQSCTYARIGNVVMVWGGCSIDPTATGSSTVLRISLPIASNFANTQQLDGTAVSPLVFGLCAAIFADPTNDVAQLQFISDGTAANNSWTFHFGYQVI
jgi:hypothetical protein